MEGGANTHILSLIAWEFQLGAGHNSPSEVRQHIIARAVGDSILLVDKVVVIIA